MPLKLEAADAPPEVDDGKDDTSWADLVGGDEEVDVRATAEAPAEPEPEPAKAEVELGPELDGDEAFRRDIYKAAGELADATLHRRDMERQLKTAKAEETAAAEKLERLYKEDTKTYPLLDDAELGQVVGNVLSKEVTATREPPTPPDRTSEEAWRFTTTAELGLPPGICQKLEKENNITTFGQIVDWTSADKPLTKLIGIGQAKADKIEEVTAQYWKDHPQE